MTPERRRAFTIVEAIVILAVVGVLAALMVPTLNGALSRAGGVECAAKLRAIGNAIHSYAVENGGEFPRSFHSAGAHGQPGWTASVFPFLSGLNGGDAQLDPASFNRFFRCPSHHEDNPFVFSYGMNVHFELDPDGDDYTGSPATWRRTSQIPSPSKTILLAESRPVLFGDHLMCHLWSSQAAAVNALAGSRHGGRPSFLFVDGHVENLNPAQTFDKSRNLNLWNPALSSKGSVP